MEGTEGVQTMTVRLLEFYENGCLKQSPVAGEAKSQGLPALENWAPKQTHLRCLPAATMASNAVRLCCL